METKQAILVAAIWVGLTSAATGCATPGAHMKAPPVVAPPTDSTHDGFSLNVYRNVVRSKVLHSFAELSRDNPRAALTLMADEVHYRFEGAHALGGERITRRGVEKWFGRLQRLLKNHFVIRSVEVTGWPWSSTVYTRFEN